MKIHGDIKQIHSDGGGAYMNISSPPGCGHVSVEFSTFRTPTYLLRLKDSSVMSVMTFSSQQWADEWLETYSSIWSSIERLDKEESSVASNDSPEK